jgi:hypothetical protein
MDASTLISLALSLLGLTTAPGDGTDPSRGQKPIGG